MKTQRARGEDRENVMLTASVVDSRGSRPARISDISSRGMLGHMEMPPQRGEFIDLRFPAREVAGQVRWVNGRKFGISLRERVDVDSLLSGSRRKPAKTVPHLPEQDMSLKGIIVAYSVMGLAALSAAYLIVTYIIF
ncbi:PilZ domain-containing protein [Aurantiacibacter sp. MUD11]|uniref:PilZ domain-containing protein n=1 Tax=Aurantiacibacter sp. MUD11 TaxID=3003265 RepID=UPI0022AB4035|nr:PilZ domain-containing protein [Aurantiacibacter sp. MUD11]WAT18883.1 PilZ domain-containing protein [Aurantiacibacter sp. MUD11]